MSLKAVGGGTADAVPTGEDILRQTLDDEWRFNIFVSKMGFCRISNPKSGLLSLHPG